MHGAQVSPTRHYIKGQLRAKYFFTKKAGHKMLVQLTPCVNFINVLRTAFALVDPESVRTQSSHQYLLTLLGSTSVKAVRRMLMKSTPRVKFINILCKCFFV